jgi:hypothetical protein
LNLRPRLVSWGLIVAGLALVAGWCALVLPALLVAESGAGLRLPERAPVAAPLAVASALLVVGGWLAGRRGPDAAGARRGTAVELAVLVGIATGVAAMLVVAVGR